MLTREIAKHALTEYEPHRFSTCASDLMAYLPEFKDGNFPGEIKTELGNGLPFGIILKMAPEGHLEYVTYRQDCGCLILKVFND